MEIRSFSRVTGKPDVIGSSVDSYRKRPWLGLGRTGREQSHDATRRPDVRHLS
jgi:hypothetical protein